MATMVASPIDADATLPYILDMFPHLQVGDSSPLENLQLALSRWGNLSKPHIVADAAFGSIDMLTKISEWGGTATFSCSSNNVAWLWELLSYNLPIAHWRGAMQPSTGFIAAIHAASDDNRKITYQQLISNSWNGVLKAVERSEDAEATSMPIFTRDHIKNMTIEELVLFARNIISKWEKLRLAM
jgi:hypothetical protein